MLKKILQDRDKEEVNNEDGVVIKSWTDKNYKQEKLRETRCLAHGEWVKYKTMFCSCFQEGQMVVSFCQEGQEFSKCQEMFCVMKRLKICSLKFLHEGIEGSIKQLE